MRWFLVSAVVIPLFVAGCGRADDEGYCIGPYGESLDRWGVPAYEGTACSWADKAACDGAGGAWVDYVDTEFDFSENEDDLARYCASEGYPTSCRDGELYTADEAGCPAAE